MVNIKLSKKQIFILFLLINALAWIILSSFRNIIGNDALEAISWGELVDFGTNKHPPLSGWLMGGFYNLFGHHDIAAYILGQVSILIGYVFIYKLAKFFLDEEKAFCSSLIMSSCYYYTYIAFYENFNCNFLSMALWPMIAYYFYKSVKEDKLKDWIIFGATAALGMLCKYQVIFLYLALFLYLVISDRKQFKKKGMYVAILTGLLVILPHILWLYKNDFFSFVYMFKASDVDSHNMPEFLLRYGRIVFPIKFIADQLLSVASCIVLYLILALQAKNIGINKDGKTSEKVFLLSVGLAPILAQSCMAAIENNRILGMWGSIMVSFSGILLFYFFPVKFNKDTFNFCVKWVYSLMILWLIGMFAFLQLQTKLHMSFPYQEIIPNINAEWDRVTNGAELKYVGGVVDYVYKIKEYNPRHPKIIIETFGHENPWADNEDIVNSGAIIVDTGEQRVIDRARELIVLLPADYKIEPVKYEFEITNKAGKSKPFMFYYAVIPPRKAS